MKNADRNLLYPVERAIEHAADLEGVRPVRVHRLGFPLHVAEVSATIQAREPFDLLDRYVGLAIADAGFRSVTDIAGFLGVTEAVVDRVLRFLGGIGHLHGTDGSLALTELGQRAARDDLRYTLKQDRLKLYFDGVRCEPLPSAYYGRSVQILTGEAALEQRRFSLLDHSCDFRTDAVAQLSQRRDRNAFNLPDEHMDLGVLGAGTAFLPCYLIRARTESGHRSLLYTGVDSVNDGHLEQLVEGWPGIERALRVEDEERDNSRREELTGWLQDRNISAQRLTWLDHERLRLTLPTAHFPLTETPSKEKGTFSLLQLGSYVTPHSHVLQLWCEHTGTRRKAALERALSYVTGVRRRDTDDVVRFLDQISRRLELDPALGLGDLRAHATRTGHGSLGL